jgi:hypothetical protein
MFIKISAKIYQKLIFLHTYNVFVDARSCQYFDPIGKHWKDRKHNESSECLIIGWVLEDATLAKVTYLYSMTSQI